MAAKAKSRNTTASHNTDMVYPSFTLVLYGRWPSGRCSRLWRDEFQRWRLRAAVGEREPLTVAANRVEILGIVPAAVLDVVQRHREIVARRKALDLVSSLLIGAHGAHPARVFPPLRRIIGEQQHGP